MNSRCIWLQETREYLKQDIPKKRYFKIHKNLQSPDQSPKHSPDTTPRALSIPNNAYKSISDPIKPNPSSLDYDHLIKKKDSEIKTLQNLYSEANNRFKSLEKTLFIKPNPYSLNSFRKPSINLISPLKTTMKPPSRTKSTLNYRKPNPENSSIHQRLLKNRPKIVLSSPITGLPLKYIN